MGGLNSILVNEQSVNYTICHKKVKEIVVMMRSIYRSFASWADYQWFEYVPSRNGVYQGPSGIWASLYDPLKSATRFVPSSHSVVDSSYQPTLPSLLDGEPPQTLLYFGSSSTQVPKHWYGTSSTSVTMTLLFFRVNVEVLEEPPELMASPPAV